MVKKVDMLDRIDRNNYNNVFGITKNIRVFRLLLFVFFVVNISCNPIVDRGWESGGDMKYINKDDPNLVILAQDYQTGAWDADGYMRVILKNLELGTISSIDTSLLKKESWIKFDVPIRDWDDHGNYLYDAELNSLRGVQDSLFKHRNLGEFTEVLLPLEQYFLLSRSKFCYSVQESSEMIKTYVFYSGGGLVLQGHSPSETTTKVFEHWNNQ